MSTLPTVTTIEDVIAAARHTRNLNKVLPSRSRRPEHVHLRTEIIRRTPFLPTTADLRERLWYIEHQQTTPPLCETCNTNPVSWDYTNQKFRFCCSPTCVGNNTRVQAQKQHTCLSTTGHPFPAQSQTSRAKYKQTMQERHGSPYFNQGKLVASGALSVLTDVDAMTQMTNVEHLSTFDIGNRLNVSQATASKYRARHGIPPRAKSSSSLQREIVDTIKSLYDGIVETNTRKVIAPQEIDIYLPSLRLAFEVDGIFWHGELSGKKSKRYHLEKTIKAESHGVRLVHIFETDWTHHREATVSRLKSLLHLNTKLPARRTRVVEMSSADAVQFCDANHIQGSVPSSVRYGLEHNGQLVACMTFGKSRYNSYQWEMLRFCSISGITVVGGASKLLQHFIRTKAPTSIVSYCDLRWGTGKTYQCIGFTLSHTSSPNYWYFIPPSTTLMSRVLFQKHKLTNIVSIYNQEWSEWEIMKHNGYDRIWDCGNQVWVWTPAS